jgi:hypothetical protein
MKKFFAAIICITLLGMPALGQDCCAEKQQAQKQTQKCESSKQCSKDKTAQKSCCDSKKMSEQSDKKESAKACTGCTKSTETWLTAPAPCKKDCKTASV